MIWLFQSCAALSLRILQLHCSWGSDFTCPELARPAGCHAAPSPPARLAVQEMRRVGGPLSMKPSDVLHLRVFVDRSCVEVYAGSGEVSAAALTHYCMHKPSPAA